MRVRGASLGVAICMVASVGRSAQAQVQTPSQLPRVGTVTPIGRGNLDCQARIDAIEHAATAIPRKSR